MALSNKIVKPSISAVLITALLSVYFSPALRVLCSKNGNTTMTCCKQENSSKNRVQPGSLFLRSMNKCPCPSIQSGRDTPFDEALPTSVKPDPRVHATPVQIQNLSNIIPFAPSNVVLNGYTHSYLSAQDRISILQTYLI